MKYFTVRDRGDSCSKSLRKRIEDELIKHGYVFDEDKAEVVFVIGGDGTFLKCVYEFVDRLAKVCFYGIHTGTLGFLMDCQECELEQFLQNFMNESYTIKQYPLLKAEFDDQCVYALNEIRIENILRTQQMDIILNDTFFETYRGTGICVSSQVGSTAYNRSIGGSVVQDGLSILQLSEISGIHHRAYRSLGSSLIMKDDTQIHCISSNFQGAILGYDSHVVELDKQQEILITTSKNHIVRVISASGLSYFKRLEALF